jgi:hypothetical protein
MRWIVIEGVKPYDGRYPFDLAGAEPTTREWGWIKRLSGYMPATIDDGLDGGDPELFSVFAVIALRRAGRVDNSEVPEVFERFIDAPFARSIRAENDSDEAEQDEDDAGPPASSSPANGTSSGPVSRTSSGRSATASPSGSGTPASATSVSLPAGSAT